MINPEYLHKIVRPDDTLLDQCHEVLICDPKFRQREMRAWCFENQLSLVWSQVVETMDVSPTHDHIAGFYFIDAKDATLFSLKFK
jgi:hypothetical protein